MKVICHALFFSLNHSSRPLCISYHIMSYHIISYRIVSYCVKIVWIVSTYIFIQKHEKERKKRIFRVLEDPIESIQTHSRVHLGACGCLPKMSHKIFSLQCTVHIGWIKFKRVLIRIILDSYV